MQINYTQKTNLCEFNLYKYFCERLMGSRKINFAYIGGYYYGKTNTF